jgi:hypothetical protein
MKRYTLTFLALILCASLAHGQAYTRTKSFTAGTMARGSDVAFEFDAIATVLNALPTAATLEDGTLDVAAAGGTADAITLTTADGWASYQDGASITFVAQLDNTGAVTLNVDGLGARSLVRQDGSPMTAGDILQNYIVNARYTGAANFQYIGATASYLADVTSGVTDAETAAAAAQLAQTNAETAETNAELAEVNAEAAQTYATEWANKAEDSLVSVSAGGDGVDDYSAMHHAIKACELDEANAQRGQAGPELPGHPGPAERAVRAVPPLGNCGAAGHRRWRPACGIGELCGRPRPRRSLAAYAREAHRGVPALVCAAGCAGDEGPGLVLAGPGPRGFSGRLDDHDLRRIPLCWHRDRPARPRVDGDALAPPAGQGLGDGTAVARAATSSLPLRRAVALHCAAAGALRL